MIKEKYIKWSEEDISKLIELYPHNSNKYIANELNTTESIVASKSSKLKLYKSLEYKCQIRHTEWSKEQIEKLIKLHPIVKNEDIAKELNFSISSIKNKAHKLGLSKPSEFRGENTGKANKIRMRDLTYDILKNIALKYKTKREFSCNDSSAYETARRAGFLQEICKHMSVVGFSIPQLILRDILDSLLKSESLYNDRQTINPYEIDVYYPKLNLAFEYQGKRWHIDNYNPNDSIKSKIFKERNINIIYIFENSSKYEIDIKTQLKNKLSEINTICNTKITSKDVDNYVVGNIYLKLYSEEELFSVAKNYNSLKEFRKSEKSVYSKLCRMKLINEATKHMIN